MINLPLSPTYHPLQSYARHQRYIAIEGADGVGKSTVARKLVDYLNTHLERGLCLGTNDSPAEPNALLRVQPTNGEIGGMIRKLLRSSEVNDTALQLLFAADRIAASKEVRARLEEGHHVISDRCELSSAVYYAAAKPRFKCEVCGEEVEEEGATGTYAMRWVYDAEWKQKELVRVDAWRHSSNCDADLTDIHDRRFREALSWNKEAVHPSIILVLVADTNVAKERLRARGVQPDSMERDVIQKRANLIYLRSIFSRAKLPGSPRVVWIKANKSEGDVFETCLNEVLVAVRNWEADDVCGVEQPVPMGSVPLFSRTAWEVFNADNPGKRPIHVFENLTDLCSTYRQFDNPMMIDRLSNIPLGTFIVEAHNDANLAIRRCCQRDYSSL